MKCHGDELAHDVYDFFVGALIWDFLWAGMGWGEWNGFTFALLVFVYFGCFDLLGYRADERCRNYHMSSIVIVIFGSKPFQVPNRRMFL